MITESHCAGCNHPLAIYNLIQLGCSQTLKFSCVTHAHACTNKAIHSSQFHIQLINYSQPSSLSHFSHLSLLFLPFSLSIFLSFCYVPSLFSLSIAVLPATLYHSNMKTSLRSCTPSNCSCSLGVLFPSITFCQSADNKRDAQTGRLSGPLFALCVCVCAFTAESLLDVDTLSVTFISKTLQVSSKTHLVVVVVSISSCPSRIFKSDLKFPQLYLCVVFCACLHICKCCVLHNCIHYNVLIKLPVLHWRTHSVCVILLNR